MWRDIGRRWRLRRMVRSIGKHGWITVHVPDRDWDGAIHTVGLWESLGSPELILFGLSQEVGASWLTEARRQLQSGELILADKARWTLPGWVGGPALAWRAVHPSQVRQAYFNAAIWYRAHQGASPEGLQAFQLFIGDPDGKFSWEDGFDPYRGVRQPDLYLPEPG